MRKIGFVPIRLNSKRVPGKNIKLLNNKPLITYNLETLLTVGLDEIYVYCSSGEICGYLPPGVTWLPRDPALDGDGTRGIDVWMAFEAAIQADMIVMSHATAPFIKAGSILEGIRRVQYEGYDSSCSVSRIQTYCWYKGAPLNFEKGAILQTQLLEPVFVESGGFYVWKKGLVARCGSRISGLHAFVAISDIEAVDIDDPGDFEIAEVIARGLANR